MSCTYVVKFFILVFALGLASCSGSGNGFAPGGTPAVIQPNNNIYLSTADQFATSNGWKVDADQVTPVQAKTLFNGWKIEVRFE